MTGGVAAGIQGMAAAVAGTGTDTTIEIGAGVIGTMTVTVATIDEVIGTMIVATTGDRRGLTTTDAAVVEEARRAEVTPLPCLPNGSPRTEFRL